MQLTIAGAERPRPGASPVSPHSDFAPVATAVPLPWAPVEPAPASVPGGSGRIRVDLGGRWERWVDVDGDPSFPEPGARAAHGPPADVTWQKVVVPENFGVDDEHSRQFAPVWYRRRVADPRLGGVPDAPQHVRLRFAAVDYLADVWMNGEYVGHHEGSFAPFGFDVGDRLRRDNEVLVAVQDPLEALDPSALFFAHRKRVIKGTLKYHDSRPGGLPGRMLEPLAPGEDPWVWTPEWGQSMTTGGITGPVTLERTTDVTIDALFVTPLADDRAQIAVVVTNRSTTTRSVLIHLGLGGASNALAVELPHGTGRVDVVADVVGWARWSAAGSGGDVALHEVVAVVADAADGRVLDRRVTTTGLRTAQLVLDEQGAARHLELDGQPVFVKAVNYIPWQHFAEVGRSFYDRDFRLVRDAHANSVGVHAHVQSPHCYEAADTAGILVFQDFPLQWFYDSGTTTNPGFVDEACRQIADMAYLLHNHPCVVYYACHNEPARMFGRATGVATPDDPETDVGESHLDAALAATLREIDDQRHVHEASGIGDDAHCYQGSLAGARIERVREQPAWFVSEYGFWTVGPQAHRFGDRGWPPTPTQMREWVSRLSFIGSTVSFAGLPSRYASLEAWADATQEYGSALAQYQTEWFRAKRGAPYMGYRWHFWSDWWGYAGGGLVDVDRVPKLTYHAYAAASRPLLVLGVHERSVVDTERTTVEIVAVNDRRAAARGRIEWEVHDSTSAVFAPDFDGARVGLPAPPDRDAFVAVARALGDRLGAGSWSGELAPEGVTPVASVDLELAPGASRTILLRWTDPELGPQDNAVHVHRLDPSRDLLPGLNEP